MLSSEKIRLDVKNTERLCREILLKKGFSEDNARIVTDNLLFADLRGVSTHGITRLGTYCDRVQKGLYNPTPYVQIIHETTSALALDGDNGLGALVGAQAMELTMEKAEKTGVCLTTVRRSNHFGAASYFSMMASKRDMIGFSCANSLPNMAPAGSRAPMLGTNPFSVSVPGGRYGELVLDIATSVAARGNIINAAKNSGVIPAGWALDAEGNPTINAHEALLGAVLPFGGHKGSGIAVMIDVLAGILSGGKFGQHVALSVEEGKQPDSGIGHTFLAIDIRAFDQVEHFKARVEQMIGEIKAAPPAAGVEEVLFPGELEQRRTKENMEFGIPVSHGVYRELEQRCGLLGLTQLLEGCVL